MSEARKNLGLGAIALLPVVCCIGLPLVVAAGVSAALAAWIGGLAVGGIVLVAGVAVLVLRARKRHGGQSPPLRITRSRS